MKKHFFLFITSLLIFTSVVSFASAVIDNNTIAPLANDLNAPVTSVEGMADLLIKLIQWIYTFIFIFAVLFILISAFNFVTSNGDEKKVAKAKQELIWAIVGVAVALLSYAIVAVTKNLITGDTAPSSSLNSGSIEVHNTPTDNNNWWVV